MAAILAACANLEAGAVCALSDDGSLIFDALIRAAQAACELRRP